MVVQEFEIGKAIVRIHDDCIPKTPAGREQADVELANTVWTILKNSWNKKRLNEPLLD